MDTLQEIIEAYERLSELSDDELDALRAAIREFYESVADNPEIPDDELDQLADMGGEVIAEAERRKQAAAEEEALAAEAEAERAERRRARDAVILGEDETVDEEETTVEAETEEEPEEVPVEPEAVEPEVEEEPVPVAAAAQPNRAQRRAATRKAPRAERMRSLAAAAERQRPTARPGDDRPSRQVLVASTGVPDFTAGGAIESEEDFGRALAGKWDRVSGSPGRPGQDQERLPVLKMRRNYAHTISDREARDPVAVMSVMDRAVAEFLDAQERQLASLTPTTRDREVMVASGGPCAPATVDYTVPFVGGRARPFRNAFPSVGAPRGRVRYFPPLCFDRAEIDAATGRTVTIEEDTAGYESAGGTTADKTCVRIDCPTEEPECGTKAHVQCVTIGNWVDRSFPEYVSAWREQIDSHFAATTEETHMADFTAFATPINHGAPELGATRDTFKFLSNLAERIRGARRLDTYARVHVAVPTWFRRQIKMDLAMAPWGSDDGFRQFRVSDADIVSWFDGWGMSLSFYLDESGPSIGGFHQALDLPGAGELVELPEEARAFVWLEGDVIRLTQPDLDLGVYRDSGLNATNDFQAFMEEFSQLCFRGCAGTAFVADLATCVNGASAGTVAPTECIAS